MGLPIAPPSLSAASNTSNVMRAKVQGRGFKIISSLIFPRSVSKSSRTWRNKTELTWNPPLSGLVFLVLEGVMCAIERKEELV